MINKQRTKEKCIQGGEEMKKLEHFVAKAARDYADKSLNCWLCNFIFYQPKVTEEMKQRLKEMKKKT